MAIAFVQQNKALTNTNATTQAVTWASNTTTGNLIVVATSSSTTPTARVTSVTDSQGNVYSQAVGVNSGSFFLEVWYAVNIVGGTTPTVTTNYSAATRPGVLIMEISGCATSSPLDIATVNSVASTTAYSIGPTIKTRASNEIVIAIAHAGSNNTFLVGAGYSNLQQQTATTVGSHLMESKIISASAEHTATATLNVSAAAGRMAIVSFADMPLSQPSTITNYQFVRVGDGMSTSEKIR